MIKRIFMKKEKIKSIKKLENRISIDISVTGDNLFFANEILTHNSGLTSDPSMTDTAESMGLPSILDFYVALIRTEELDEENKILFKQLKSRYDDLTKMQKVVLGCNRSRMTYYDLDNDRKIFTNEEKEEIVTNFNRNKKPKNVGGFK